MDTALDVPKLKVAELRSELAARNLSTVGLKAELAARLTEYLDSLDADTAEQVDATEKSPSVAAADGEQTALETGGEREADAAQEEPKEPVSESAQQESGADGQQHDDQSPEAARQSSDNHDGPDGAVADLTARGVEAADTETGEPSADHRAATNGSAQEGDGRKRKAEDELNDSATSPDAATTDRRELPPWTDGTDPAAATDTTGGEAVKDRRQRRHEITSTSAPRHPPTRSLYIGNLVRPLVPAQVRAKLEEFGALSDAPTSEDEAAAAVRYDGLWLDGIKTHAYVTFETEAAAQRAHDTLDSTSFPDPTSRAVSVRYLPPHLVRSLIAQEEAAWSDAGGRQRLHLLVSQSSPPTTTDGDADAKEATNGESTGPVFDFVLVDAGKLAEEGKGQGDGATKRERKKKKVAPGPPPPVPDLGRSMAAGIDVDRTDRRAGGGANGGGLGSRLSQPNRGPARGSAGWDEGRRDRPSGSAWPTNRYAGGGDSYRPDLPMRERDRSAAWDRPRDGEREERTRWRADERRSARDGDGSREWQRAPDRRDRNETGYTKPRAGSRSPPPPPRGASGSGTGSGSGSKESRWADRDSDRNRDREHAGERGWKAPRREDNDERDRVPSRRRWDGYDDDDKARARAGGGGGEYRRPPPPTREDDRDYDRDRNRPRERERGYDRAADRSRW